MILLHRDTCYLERMTLPRYNRSRTRPGCATQAVRPVNVQNVQVTKEPSRLRIPNDFAPHVASELGLDASQSGDVEQLTSITSGTTVDSAQTRVVSYDT